MKPFARYVAQSPQSTGYYMLAHALPEFDQYREQQAPVEVLIAVGTQKHEVLAMLDHIRADIERGWIHRQQNVIELFEELPVIEEAARRAGMTEEQRMAEDGFGERDGSDATCTVCSKRGHDSDAHRDGREASQ